MSEQKTPQETAQENEDLKNRHEIQVEENALSKEAGFNVSTKDDPLQTPTAKSSHVLILGGGVSGLLTAWMLLDKGYRVTILAKEWARTWDFSESRITSQIAGALWEMPPGGEDKPGWAKVAQYQEWAMQSYNFYMKYAEIDNEHEKGGHSFGLSVATLHQFFYEDIISITNESPATLKAHNAKFQEVEKRFKSNVSTYKTAKEIENKFNTSLINLAYGGETFQSGYSHKAPILNTDKSLAYLMALVQRKGATLETRKIKNLRESGPQLLKDYEAHVIVNATGLGAKKLLNDEDVYPVRGAIRRVDNVRHGQFRHLNDAYLVPAQIGPGDLPSKTVFIVPRSDDILYVGSIIQPHNEQMNLTPDSPEVQQMWNRAGDFMPSLRHAAFRNHFPFAQGLRPFTKKNVKVRADEDFGFPLVHNYGHGGSGWTLGVGTAHTAVCIVEEILKDKVAFTKAVNSSGLTEPQKPLVCRNIKENKSWKTGKTQQEIDTLKYLDVDPVIVELNKETETVLKDRLLKVAQSLKNNLSKPLSDASAKVTNAKLYAVEGAAAVEGSAAVEGAAVGA
ncbi:D-amino-acid oxidase [Penicillium brevicompactum]|uniref:D-amino-acid oxidase n=1 Tax=Penicillium brevicompactum TaxID=5074 RepID=A0A9W9RMK8_PENBR|nr:D-amino-acid oxidase [Penicillium brevicompactum]